MTRFAVLSLLLFALLAPSVAADDDGGDAASRDSAWRGLAIYGGIFDVLEDETSEEFGLEYRFKPRKVFGWIDLKPVIGATVGTDDNRWIYAGFRYDWELSEHWVVTPSFAVSLYDEGDEGKDLGGPIEFRSGIEIAARFANGHRLGLTLYHLSNARIYDRNPGSESLVLTWSFGR
ncbi:MAG: acyloxyacyl hydrolase [Acidobacteriota bacterium]